MTCAVREKGYSQCAHVASVAHLGATDLDRPNPGLDRAMRPMAMTHDAVAVIRQFQVFPYGDKGIGFGDQHLSQHSAGAFTCDFGQRIVDGLRLTEGMTVVSLRMAYRSFREVLVGLTPASIRRL